MKFSASIFSKVTPGPWNVVVRDNGKRHIVMSDGRMLQDWFGSIKKADAEFVAFARDELPRLISENAKLREALELIADQNINAWCRTVASSALEEK